MGLVGGSEGESQWLSLYLFLQTAIKCLQGRYRTSYHSLHSPHPKGKPLCPADSQKIHQSLQAVPQRYDDQRGRLVAYQPSLHHEPCRSRTGGCPGMIGHRTLSITALGLSELTWSQREPWPTNLDRWIPRIRLMQIMLLVSLGICFISSRASCTEACEVHLHTCITCNL